MVLGLLIERPSYGYELHARSRRRFGNLIAFGTTQAYQAINTLLGQSMIEAFEPPESAPSQRRKRQFRIYYRVTAAGVQAFKAWLAQPVQEDSRNAELLIRLGSAGVIGAQALHQVVKDYQAQCNRRAKELDDEDEREPSRRRALAAAIEIIAAEQRLEIETQQRWCELALRRIETLED